MKKIFTLLFAITSIGFVKAQSFQLLDTGGVVVNNQTLIKTCPNNDTWSAFSEEIFVKNISATATKQVKCKRRLVTAMPATMTNYFCWVSCYGPSVNQSPAADTIEMSPNELVTVFHGYLNPNGLEGTCTIAYTFFDKNDPNDSATVNVKFISTLTGIADINKSINVSEVFPNPTNGNAFIKINNPNNFNGKKTTLKVYNVLGKEVASQNIVSATETIAINNIANLPSGVYFVTVYSDSKKLTTKRFVIE